MVAHRCPQSQLICLRAAQDKFVVLLTPVQFGRSIEHPACAALIVKEATEKEEKFGYAEEKMKRRPAV